MDLSSLPGRFQFEEFELDLKRATLERKGVAVRLRPQAFRILTLLVSRKGELVSRDEIRDTVWSADTFVDFNQGLNACIMQLREALGDQADAPRFIETVPKLGYRFIATVSTPSLTAPAITEISQPTAPLPVAAPATIALRKYAVVSSLVVIAAVLTAIVMWSPAARPQGAARAIRSIAVLPLANLGAPADGDYFADGMTEALINELARSQSLRVISRTSSVQYRGARKPIIQIARELGVDAVMEGSVQLSAGRVRITVQLIDGLTDQPVWANSYDREIKDVLGLQQQISDAVVRQIQVAVPVAGADVRRVVDPGAYDAYLRGRFFWEKRTKEAYQQAIGAFEEAIRIDPNYAEAYSGLADTLNLHADNLPREEGYPRAKAAALKALELNDTLAEAHASLGFILHRYEYDWTGAEREFRRSLELNPNYATAHHWRALNFRARGQIDPAYASMTEALARDPLSYAINVSFLGVLAGMGRCDEALTIAARTEEMYSPNRSLRGEVLADCGRYEAAIPLVEHLSEPGRHSIPNLGLIGYLYARVGRVADARKVLERLKQQGNDSLLLYVAEIHIALGDKNGAVEALSRLVATGNDRSRLLNTRMALASLRNDPRFIALQQRMNLVPPAH